MPYNDERRQRLLELRRQARASFERLEQKVNDSIVESAARLYGDGLQERVLEQEARIADLAQRIASIKDALERWAWVFCPDCGAHFEEPHHEDCRMAVILRASEASE